MSRQKLPRASEDRRRRGHVKVAEIRGGGLHVERGVESGSGPQRSQLRGEAHVSRLGVDEQRLDAQAVADQRELPALRVPHGHGEHADELLDRRLDPPALERGEDHLAVTVAAEGGAHARELSPQLAVVEHLAVEDHGVPSTR